MNLASFETFRLGEFDVAPARGEVARAGRTMRLEPKVMAVLLVLARRQGETVSREALLEEVWDGRAVTDDALTRCISALRKTLADGGVEIKALPKIGYVLTTTEQAPTTGQKTVPEGVKSWWAAAFVALLAVATVLAFRGTDERREATDLRVRPLTAMPGLELYPALAPGGGQVAFAHRDAAGQWDLYLKSVAGGEPQRLTNDSAREQHPAWSVSGDELVYVRSEGDACEIMRLVIPGGTPLTVGPCGARFIRSLDWSPDGRTLVLTVADARLDPGRMAFVALAGEAPQSSLDATLSAEDARFSPDGKAVALTLSTAIGAEDVYVLDLRSQNLRRITHDDAKVHGLEWSPDGLGIIYASNRAGSFGLHRASLAGGVPASLIPSLQDVESPSVAGDRIAYEAWTETGRLHALALTPAAPLPQLPPDSTRLEWHPDVAPDGALAFVSDRGGAPEVWLTENGAARQLTDFGDAYIHTPKFGPDGKRIAFSAPRKGRFSLFIVDREGRQTRLTTGASNDMSPAWSRDGGTLYFASDREGAWRVWKLDMATKDVSKVSDAPARAVYVAGDDELLVVDPARGGLHSIALDRPNAPAAVVVAELVPSDWANVVVKGDSIFYIRREPPDRAVLRRFVRAGARDETVAELPDFYFRSGLAVQGNGMIYASTKVEDVSLMLLERRRLAFN